MRNFLEVLFTFTATALVVCAAALLGGFLAHFLWETILTGWSWY